MSELKFDITGDNTQFLAALKQAQQGISATIDQLSKSGGKVDASMSSSAKAVGAEVQKAGKSVGKTLDTASDKINQTGERAKKVGNDLENTFKKLGAAIGGYFALSTITSFAQKVMDVRQEFESLEKSFSTLLGSDVAGKSMFNEITEFATKTPMLEKDLASAAQTMLSFNIESQKVMPILKQLGDISMGDSQKLQSLTLAFSQASSTGKLMGQDLLQMINAGFNPLAEISRTTGKSMKELKQDMENGQITIEMVESAFASATGEGGKFNGMLEGMSQTMAGAISNLEGAMQKFNNALGEAIESPIVDGVNAATNAINTLAENVDKITATIAGLTAGLGTYKVACIVAAEATKGYTIAAQIQYRWMQFLEIKQKALNAAMNANPYVLAATAIVSLCTAMGTWYALSEKQTGAQKRLNEATNEFNKNVDVETLKVKAMFDELRDAKEGTEAYEQAKQAILDQYGKYLEGLSTEISSLKDVEGAYNAVTAAVEKSARARAMHNAKEAAYEAYGENLKQTSEPLYKDLKEKLGDAGAARVLRKLRKELDETGKISRRTQMEVQDIWKGHQKSSDALMYMKGMELTTKQLKKELSDAKALFGDEEEQKKTTEKAKTNFDIEYKAAEKKYADAKKKVKEIEKERKKYSSEQYKKAVEERDAAEKEFKKLGGKTDKQQTQEENTATKLRKQKAQEMQAYSDELNKQTAERSRREKEAELNIAQYRIDALAEGSKKEIQQIELNLQKELSAIEKEKEAIIAAREQEARAIWEKANPNAGEKGQNWDNTGKVGKTFELTDTEKQMFEAREKAAQASYSRQIADRLRADAQYAIDYLKEFGTMQEQRYAIEKEYDDKIEQLRKNGASKYEIKAAERQKQKALSENYETDLLSRLDFATAFDKYGTSFKQPLEELRDELKKYIGSSSFKGKKVEEQRAIVEALNNVQGKLGGSLKGLNFAQVGKDIDKYNAALKSYNAALANQEVAQEQLTQAQKGYEKALKSGNTAEIESAKTNKDSADLTYKIATAQVQGTQQMMSEAQSNLRDSDAKLVESMKAIERMAQGLASGSASSLWNSIPKEIKNKAADAIAKALGGKSDLWSQIIGLILSILDTLKEGIGNLLQAIIQSIGDAVEGLLTEIGSGKTFARIGEAIYSLITSVIKGIGNLFSGGTFSKINWSGGNADEVNKATKENTKAIEDNTRRIEALKNVIDKSSGIQAINAGQAAIEAQKTINKKAIDTLKEQMGYSSAHHSNAYYLSDKSLRKAYAKEREYAETASGTKMVGSIKGLEDIYKLTPEQIAAISTYMPETWEILTQSGKYDKTEYWDAVVEQAGKLEEITKQVKENITNWSLDSLRDEFRSTLMDMDSDSMDFAENLTKHMTEAYLKIKMGEGDNSLNKRLEDWYDKWYEKLNDEELTDDEVRQAQDDYQKLVKEGIEMRDKYAKLTGYSDILNQKATANGIQSITADQADQLIGRITAMQIAVETSRGVQAEMAERITTGINYLMSINVVGTQANETLNAILLQHVQSNSYLEDMTKYSKGMYNEWGDKLNKITQQLERL